MGSRYEVACACALSRITETILRNQRECGSRDDGGGDKRTFHCIPPDSG
jgi:hypothetical protein